MRVFITGASGWIGSATTDELLAAGHEVVALARSDASAEKLEVKGAIVLRGDLDHLDTLRAGADTADATIHLANKHDFNNPAVSDKAERNAVQTLGDALAGSGRPLLLAAAIAGLARGRDATEKDPSQAHGPDAPRGGAENLALEYVDRDVRVISARFAPTVHGHGDHGFIASIVEAARRKGVSGYVGDGANRWSAVRRTDAARLIRMGLEEAPAGSILHAVHENGVPTRTIAEAIGAGLGIETASIAPDAAAKHFGWIGAFFSWEMAASSELTQALLGWTPSGPTLIEDLREGAYFPVSAAD